VPDRPIFFFERLRMAHLISLTSSRRAFGVFQLFVSCPLISGYDEPGIFFIKFHYSDLQALISDR
ncbi:MAG: hypothetical protein ACJATG_002545, partial [Dinoroseobacter sp.]